MPRERSARDYYDEPTEYGGVGGDNRRALSGPPLPGSPAQRARDMRREAFRTMNDSPAQNHPKRFGLG